MGIQRSLYRTAFSLFAVMLLMSVPIGVRAQEANTSSTSDASEELVEDPGEGALLFSEDPATVGSPEEIVPLSSSGEDVEVAAPEEIAASAVSEADVTLEGIVIEEPTKAPGAFGLFWRGVRERVSLAITRDPVAKAEKAIQFAEERMKIAEKILAESTDPKAQERANRVIERAQAFVQKTEEKKELFAEKNDEKTMRLLKNIAAHDLRREQVLDRIEAKLPEKQREAFIEKREALAEKNKEHGERLENAINNENIPEEVRAHLQDVKARIEAHAQEVKAFQEKRLELRDAIQQGDKDAIEALEQLKKEREMNVELRRDAIPERVKELLDKAQNGDMEAASRLNQVRDKAVSELRERALNGDETAGARLERLDTLRDTRIQLKGQVRQLPQELRDVRQGVREEVRDLREGVRGEIRDTRNDIRIERAEVREERREEKVNQPVVERPRQAVPERRAVPTQEKTQNIVPAPRPAEQQTPPPEDRVIRLRAK